MAIVTNTFTRYSAVGMREDLSNVIWNVSPQDTPFVSNIGKRKITNTTFSWQQDQLANAAANAQIDGDDVSSYTAVVATTLRTNFSQIIKKVRIIVIKGLFLDSGGQFVGYCLVWLLSVGC